MSQLKSDTQNSDVPQTFVRPLAFSEAFRFTPLTTSPLQPSDQIPLPSIGSQSQNVRLASPAERKYVAGLAITPKIHGELQRLLQPGRLSELYVANFRE
jgi:hypothetical protein